MSREEQVRLVQLSASQVAALVIPVAEYQRGPVPRQVESIRAAIRSGTWIEPIQINARNDGKSYVIDGGQRTRAAVLERSGLMALRFDGRTANEERSIFLNNDKTSKIRVAYLLATAADGGHPVASTLVRLNNDPKANVFGRIKIAKDADGKLKALKGGLDPYNLLYAFYLYQGGKKDTKKCPDLLQRTARYSRESVAAFVDAVGDVYYGGSADRKNITTPARGMVAGWGLIFKKYGLKAFHAKGIAHRFRMTKWDAIQKGKGVIAPDRISYADYMLTWYEGSLV